LYCHLNRCFHLLGGELAGIKKRFREKRDKPPGSHQCLEWSVFFKFNFMGHPKLVQDPTANKPPRLCVGAEAVNYTALGGMTCSLEEGEDERKEEGRT
jgi:hypothetical protein